MEPGILYQIYIRGPGHRARPPHGQESHWAWLLPRFNDVVTHPAPSDGLAMFLMLSGSLGLPERAWSRLGCRSLNPTCFRDGLREILSDYIERIICANSRVKPTIVCENDCN